MNEITIPALVPLASSGNLNSIVTGWANKEPNRIILSRPLGEGWQSVSASEFESEVRSEERRVGKECRSRWSPYH